VISKLETSAATVMANAIRLFRIRANPQGHARTLITLAMRHRSWPPSKKARQEGRTIVRLQPSQAGVYWGHLEARIPTLAFGGNHG
jgi:hypothetical protein